MDKHEWNSDWSAKCSICGFERGEHYDAYCPKKDGQRPSLRIGGSSLFPIAGPDAPRGQYGVPIAYLPDGTWEFVHRPLINYPNMISGASSSNKIGPPINDHVCPTCKNDRCSKSEKSCWKCGGKL
jgi:hypothetical protein